MLLLVVVVVGVGVDTDPHKDPGAADRVREYFLQNIFCIIQSDFGENY